MSSIKYRDFRQLFFDYPPKHTLLYSRRIVITFYIAAEQTRFHCTRAAIYYDGCMTMDFLVRDGYSVQGMLNIRPWHW